jgi:membrane-associated phospholipid phosphatase
MCGMDSATAWIANYLLYVMAVGFAVVWLVLEPKAGKVRLAVAAVAGLAVAGVLLYLAGKAYTDVRPLCLPNGTLNPNVHALISHGCDSGFPSDHSVAAGLIATLVILRRLWYGVGFWVAAVLVALARVHARVHHYGDVIAGLALGAVGAIIGTVLAVWLTKKFGGRFGLQYRVSANSASRTP